MRNQLRVLLLMAGLMASGAVVADESLGGWLINVFREKEIKPADNKAWNEECGACHFAYQPGLLPTKSWEKLLNDQALSDHFGEDASLDKETLQELLAYAQTHAADKSYSKRARKIAVATEQGSAPLRITDVRYIKRKHHEIPEKMIKGNKDVKSLSYCNACHTKAEKGIFESDTVSIPNYPDWDD